MLRTWHWLRAFPWAAGLGSIVFLTVLLVTWEHLLPMPRLVFKSSEPLYPVELTDDGLVVTFVPAGQRQTLQLGYRFWDAHTGLPVSVTDETGQPIDNVVEIVGRGAILLTGDDQLFVRRQPRVYERRQLPEDVVPRRGEVGASPSGPFVVNAYGRVLCCDVLNANKVTQLPVKTTSLAISANGAWLATGDDGDPEALVSRCPVVVWDLASGARKCTFDVFPGRLLELRFAADGRYLAACCHGPFDKTSTQWVKMTFVWDVQRAEQVGVLRDSELSGFVADGNGLLVLRGRDAPAGSWVDFLDLATRQVRYSTPLRKDPLQAASGPCGISERSDWFAVHERFTSRPPAYVKRVATALRLSSFGQDTFTSTTQVFNVKTGRRHARIAGGEMTASLREGALSPDGQALVVDGSASDGSRVAIYDLPIRRPWPRLLATALVAALAVANLQLLLAAFARRVRRK